MPRTLFVTATVGITHESAVRWLVAIDSYGQLWERNYYVSEKRWGDWQRIESPLEDLRDDPV